MKLGPTLHWFSCMGFDKTIRYFYASVLHLKNENITSHFSPSEARVKIKLTENAMAMKSKVPETRWTERYDKAQEISKKRHVSEMREWLMASTLQCKLTPLWHLQVSGMCLVWGSAH